MPRRAPGTSDLAGNLRSLIDRVGSTAAPKLPPQTERLPSSAPALGGTDANRRFKSPSIVDAAAGFNPGSVAGATDVAVGENRY